MKSGVISLSSYKTSILFIAGVPSGGIDERKTVRSILHFMSDTENDVDSNIADSMVDEMIRGRAGRHDSGRCVGFLDSSISEQDMVLWVADPDDHVNIAHEAFHAVARIMRRIGARLESASEECYAYLLSDIIRQANDIVKTNQAAQANDIVKTNQAADTDTVNSKTASMTNDYMTDNYDDTCLCPL